jgi:WD repeat-containing protein 19
VIIQSGSDRFSLFDVATRSLSSVESGLKEVTWARWARHAPLLALGGSKGGLVL